MLRLCRSNGVNVSLMAQVSTFFVESAAALWRLFASTDDASSPGSADAPAPPDTPALDSGDTGGGGSGGGDDSGFGGGDSGFNAGDTGINWGDTGWEGWEDWDTGYPYVETDDQTCYAAEKYEKPVCYAKGGRTQEAEVIVQGLKCSAVAAEVPLVGLSWVLVLGLVVWRTRR